MARRRATDARPPAPRPNLRIARDSTIPKLLAAALERRDVGVAMDAIDELRRRNLVAPQRDLVERAHWWLAGGLAARGRHRECEQLVESAFESGAGSPRLADLAFHAALARGAGREALRWAAAPAIDAEMRSALLADLAILAPDCMALPRRASSTGKGKTASGSGRGAATKAKVEAAPRGNRADRAGPAGLSGPAGPAGLSDRSGPAGPAGRAGPAGPAGPEEPSEAVHADSPEAAAVRRAFALYEQRLDDDAREALSTIGRRSPWARWRLLLLGLIARSAGEPERARQSWERIAGFGAAGSLARTLLEGPPPAPGATDGGQGPGVDPPHPFPVRRIEEDLLPFLEALKAALDAEAPGRKRLSPAVRRLLEGWSAKASPQARERLHRAILAGKALSDAVLKDLAALLGTLPDDPHGTRCAALAAEKDHPERAHALWKRYLGEIPFDETRDNSRHQVRLALLWERMGDIASRDRKDSAGACACAECRRKRIRLLEKMEPGASECYGESARLAPESLPVRKKLVKTLRAQGRKKDAQREEEAILERWPTDVPTILEMGEEALGRKAYQKAESIFERARSLEPLNRVVRARLADCIVGSAWRAATGGRIAVARREIARALDLVGEREFGRHQSVAAAVACLAGDPAAAEAAVQSAVACGEWEVDVLYRAAKTLGNRAKKTRMEERLEERLRRLSLDPKTVARAAALYSELHEGGEEPRGLGRRIEPLMREYLALGADLPIPEEIRLTMCHALRLSDRPRLVRAFAAAGRKQFPSSYEFPALEAWGRLSAGEVDLPKNLQVALATARRRAQAAQDLDAVKVIDEIQEMRRRSRFYPESLLGEYLESMVDRLGLFDDDDDDEDDDDDDYEDEDDEDEDDDW